MRTVAIFAAAIAFVAPVLAQSDAASVLSSLPSCGVCSIVTLHQLWFTDNLTSKHVSLAVSLPPAAHLPTPLACAPTLPTSLALLPA
ncbi:unnamed protein product [Aureobasidium vineae]|uniref:Secreted protein n=1 Tax=Aureobasidium vineae TaxID=2773715 RepID=A0A9N8P8Y1_9PEZI|nr:unnamed protein product [Aureobasidium vineae]